MDTDAVVAAMRSPGGASAALLRAARQGRATLVATAPLCIEYESVSSRAVHTEAAGFGPADLVVFLDALMDLVEPVEAWFLWRPQLRDPGDELVLEAAVNGRAAAVATFNRRDFLPGATRFGIDVLLRSTVLGAMPDTENLHVLRGDAIYDDIGPHRGQFAGAGDQARAPALGQVVQPVAGGEELHGHAVRGSRVLLPDVGSDPRQVRPRRSGEGYGHGGGGSSASVPQDSSQRRTSS